MPTSHQAHPPGPEAAAAAQPGPAATGPTATASPATEQFVEDLYRGQALRLTRALGKIGTGGRFPVGPVIIPDTADKHMIMYGYTSCRPAVRHQARQCDQQRMSEMNLVPGHLTWIASAVAPVTELGFDTVAW